MQWLLVTFLSNLSLLHTLEAVISRHKVLGSAKDPALLA